MASSPIDWYNLHAADVAGRYETIDFAQTHAWLLDRLPPAPLLVLDVGAGSGRDAAGFAARGDEVVAVEPAEALRALARKRYVSPRIRWVDDRLPGLDACQRLGTGFDLILLSAVWMHVLPVERDRAFRKLIALLRPGGRLAFLLRQGPDDLGRSMWPVSAGEIERQAVCHGAACEVLPPAFDSLGGAGVTWLRVVVRLPDDGTGAMPQLRQIIVNDDKSSTYKLALLRVLCRIATGSAGLAEQANGGKAFATPGAADDATRSVDDDDHTDLPFGLVGLYWLRLYLPLLAAGLPQSGQNDGLRGLGFVRDDFLAIRDMSPLDLRIGACFAGPMATHLYRALKRACDTIRDMPVKYIRNSAGQPLLSVVPARRRMAEAEGLSLDALTLWSFGSLRVPTGIWQCLARFDAWIEPALMLEWVLMMKAYASSKGRLLDDAAIARAMTWSEGDRDARLARGRALTLLERGSVHCVWTGKRLASATLDIDHCLPWTVWPCDALWNLLPAHPSVNRHLKRDRLPADTLLLKARDPIEAWWRAAWQDMPGEALPVRFFEEARATLPGLPRAQQATQVADVFDGLRLQRLRLRMNQQASEWGGEVH